MSSCDGFPGIPRIRQARRLTFCESFPVTYEDLTEDFRGRGISFESPGFCDDPSFFDGGTNDPDYLNYYAAFVAKRPYDPNYLARAHVIIDKPFSATLCVSPLHTP